jgi:glycopeptide antibiotics resistance protein
MNIRVLVRSLFAIWAIAVAVLSVISYPGSNDLLMSVKLTSSGFVIHCIAYFMGIFLCYFAFDKKNISFVLWAGLLIFLFSMILEIAQFYLPYRTFNVYDVVGNGVGILSFVVIMLKRGNVRTWER